MNVLVTLRDTALKRKRELVDEDEGDEQRGLVGQAIHTALLPLRIATSRPAIKLYITALLFFITSITLISISTTAYLVFYYNYIPQIGLTQTVYLQYDSNTHPYAVAAIDASALISQQPYDIRVSLDMPRTPANMAAGNFMLDLSLLGEPPILAGPLSYLFNTSAGASMITPLARSRRAAILPYSSHLTSLSHKLLRLPFHLLSLQDLDTSVLNVDMFERLSFQRGRTNIPTTAYLEIQSQSVPGNCPPSSQSAIGVHILSSPSIASSPALQIYSAQIHFHARFEGLRYYVYNYRIIAFFIFSTLFYTFTITSMTVAWALIASVISARNSKPEFSDARIKDKPDHSSNEPQAQIKDEKDVDIKTEDDSDLDNNDNNQLDSQALANLSGTERTFPTLGRQSQPIRYTPSSTTAPSEDAESAWSVQRDDVTHDAEDEDEDDGTSQAIPQLTDLKDEDEDDETVFRGDSGIGTSMESEPATAAAGLGLVRRRSTRGSRSSGGGAGARR